MGFQHLTDIHTRGNAKRVQNDIYRSSIGAERHILNRDNLGNYTLVPMASCHLVSRLNPALYCQINLHHLENARRQVITYGDLALFLFQTLVHFFALLGDLFSDFLQLEIELFFLEANIQPL